MIGITLQARPNRMQKQALSQWMGSARFIWNAKCEEEKYLQGFARKYLPVGTYPTIDQSYSKYKSKELTPWLYKVPSQILRNSTSNWYATYKKFLGRGCGKPKRKNKRNGGSIHLTRELFNFEKCSDGVTRLFIGTKEKFQLGYLSIKNHRKYKIPNSLYIKQKNGKYTVSLCYEEETSSCPFSEDHLKQLSTYTEEDLRRVTLGIDRGVKRPIQAGGEAFNFSPESEKSKDRTLKKLRQRQKALSRSQKNSNRYKKKKQSLSKAHEKVANIRKDFCHQVSRKLVNKEEVNVFVLEDLKTKNMTKSPQKKETSKGDFRRKGVRQKSSLNRSILDKGWHQFEVFLSYKAAKTGKAVFKVPAYHTSQECAACGYTHSNNRQTQSKFCCQSCGHTDHADQNAAEVIKLRAIQLILDSGTELSKRGVLIDKGRGVTDKTKEANATFASNKEASKKTELKQIA